MCLFCLFLIKADLLLLEVDCVFLYILFLRLCFDYSKFGHLFLNDVVCQEIF